MIWLYVLMACLALAFFGRDALRTFFRPSPTRAKARSRELDSRPGMSAPWLLAECARLASAGAAWSEISAAVNPGDDSHVDALLGRIRAANMGEPLPILKAIEAGCREALADNDAASAFDAFSVAARNSQWTSVAKW